MIIRKAFKYRLNTNTETAQLMSQYAGNCRFLWNKALAQNLFRLEHKQPIYILSFLAPLWLPIFVAKICQYLLTILDREIVGNIVGAAIYGSLFIRVMLVVKLTDGTGAVGFVYITLYLFLALFVLFWTGWLSLIMIGMH